MTTTEQVMTEARKNNRVCPQPIYWKELYDLLPDRRRKGWGYEPALPLILAAWWDTSDIMKMARLREHVEWASTHGCLAEVHRFLCALQESEWHHIGD